MRQLSLAITLGLGFGLLMSGCGPTADDTPPPKATGPAADADAKPEPAKEAPTLTGEPKGPAPGAMKGGGGPGAGGGGSGAGGPPQDIMKGMQSDAYRKMAGSEGPGAPKAKVGGGGPGGAGAMPPGYKPPDGTTGPGGTKAEPPKKDGDAKPAEEPKKDGDAKPATEPKKDTVALSDEEIANIKKLPSAEDQKLALAQKLCAVSAVDTSDEVSHLGSMGVPIKETVKGKTVFLCCKGCIEDLKKDPDKYLAKLPK